MMTEQAAVTKVVLQFRGMQLAHNTLRSDALEKQCNIMRYIHCESTYLKADEGVAAPGAKAIGANLVVVQLVRLQTTGGLRIDSDWLRLTSIDSD